jgi:predicted glycogen debranching enzyme
MPEVWIGFGCSANHGIASQLLFPMPTLTFTPEHWSTADEALRREWLVTNGLGGWASGSIGGANTRRYHGTLVAALRPPIDRRVLVSKIDDWATVDGGRYGLTANEFADGTIDPRGWQYLQRFELVDGLPHWRYRLGEALLEKTVFMPYGHNATWTIYKYHLGRGPLVLEITPLLNQRDFHGQTQVSQWAPMYEFTPSGTGIHLFPGAHPIWLVNPGGSFTPDHAWIKNVYYRVEQGRGLPETEDVFKIGSIIATLTPEDTLAVLVSAEQPDPAAYHWRGALNAVQTRQRAIVDQSRLPPESPDWVKQLVLAADQFIVERTDSALQPINQWRPPLSTSNRTVIAGYPWFSDWGRDTMIALPGLTLTTHRDSEAAGILRTFAQHISQGMLPNRFPDSGETAEYNTVDATLWFFHAIDRYLQATNDEALARELFPTLEDIVSWHVRGTRYRIHVDTDGLVFAGEPGVQLTWMDAKVGDWVVTPRIGKPVEINALWINALRVMAHLAQRLTLKSGHDYVALAEKALHGFEKFWYSEQGYLFDVIDIPTDKAGATTHLLGRDTRFRPNQLFAISLPYAPLDPKSERAQAIVDKCQRELLTPYGLRSLAADSADYKPYFRGGPLERDGAYHQGTVWGWLIGPFVEAHYKVHGDKRQAVEFLKPLAGALEIFGVGSLAEVYDATLPFIPGGCFAQAWSVSEALRVWRLLTS